MSEFDALELSVFEDSSTIPDTGFIYTYSNEDQDNIAREIGMEYAKRGVSEDYSVKKFGLDLSNILDIFNLYSSSLGFASTVLSAIPAPISGYITHRITFKNDADIILIPGEIIMPGQHWCRTSADILFPGESCSALVIYPESMNDPSAEMMFSYSAISTNKDFLPSDTELDRDNARVFNFDIYLGRTDNRVRLLKMSGTWHESNLVKSTVSTNAPISGDYGLRYIGFRGLKSTSSPSFGVASIDIKMTNSASRAMTSQITFTPLSIRS